MMKKQIDIRRVVLWIVIGILAVLVLYVTLFNGSANTETLGAGKTAGQIVSSGMVGGC